MAAKKAVPREVNLDITVRGLNHYLSTREMAMIEEIIEEEGGMPCRFELEPTNEVDPNAIQVISMDQNTLLKNRFVGYVGRPANEPLTKLIRQGSSIKMCWLAWIDLKTFEGELEVHLIRPSYKTPGNGQI